MVNIMPSVTAPLVIQICKTKGPVFEAGLWAFFQIFPLLRWVDLIKYRLIMFMYHAGRIELDRISTVCSKVSKMPSKISSNSRATGVFAERYIYQCHRHIRIVDGLTQIAAYCSNRYFPSSETWGCLHTFGYNAVHTFLIRDLYIHISIRCLLGSAVMKKCNALCSGRLFLFPHNYNSPV